MKTTIGVFFGGRSVEHEISVISALQAIAALDADKYEVIPVYITKGGKWLTGSVLLDADNYRDLAALERRAKGVYMKPELGNRRLYRERGRGFAGRLTGIFTGERTVAELDIALPVLHGTNGEDGTFQGLVELIGIPYVGCGVLSSALGMDKIAMKMVLRESGLPVIDYVWFTDRQFGSYGHSYDDATVGGRGEILARIETKLGYPVIVKPANLGSSVGISRARDRAELIDAVRVASGYSSRILVERMVEPLREINCSVLGSADDFRTSVCEEPLRSGEILSYTDKYMGGRGGGAKGGVKGGAKGDGVTGYGAGSAKTCGATACGSGTKTGAKTTTGGVKSYGLGGAKTCGATAYGTGTKTGGPDGGKVPSGGMSSTLRRIPADLPEELAAQIRRLAGETFRVLGCSGVARIDFILDETGCADRTTTNHKSADGKTGAGGEPVVYINEINTIPGSLSFYLWEATTDVDRRAGVTGAGTGAISGAGAGTGASGASAGIGMNTVVGSDGQTGHGAMSSAGLSFGGLLDWLISVSLQRDRDRRQKTVSYSENIFAAGR